MEQSNTPKIKDLPERTVAYVSFQGDYVGKPEIFKDLFNKLFVWAGPKAYIIPGTLFLSSYPNNPQTTPPEELILDICMTIPKDLETEGEVKKKVLPGGQYAVLHAELSGPEEYGPVWMDVVSWAENKGLEIDMSRPSYEIYLNNPEEHPEKHHILDVCLSVKEK